METEPDDEALLQGARSGSPEAWSALYRRWVGPVYNFVFWRVGSRREVAEEVVQDCFLEAFRSLEGFRGESQFHTWLCGIARRKLADRRRKEGPVSRSLSSADPAVARMIEYLEGRQPLPQDALEREEVRSMISGCLAALPPRWQALLTGKYVENLPAGDLARREGMTETSVNSAQIGRASCRERVYVLV